MRIAVIGSGIAGLGAAWLLSKQHEVTLFESADRLGGHTNTIDVTLDGITAPVDTGFLVFNQRTYPNLIAMFEHLGIDTTRTEMTLSVAVEADNLEWSGTNANTLFGQRRNLIKPKFWSMIGDILRFNKEASASNFEDKHQNQTLGQYLSEHNYGTAFRDWYLLPMAAAIWSCPSATMLDYPVTTFSRFCLNHGLLQIFNRPPWFTVTQGARTYVEHLTQEISQIELNTPVREVIRSDLMVEVVTGAGERKAFDHVVLATHSDQTLALLGDATDLERRLLNSVGYQRNLAVVHTDTSVLPKSSSLWSAWNFSSGAGKPSENPVSVHYLINKLQPLPFQQPVIVSLNPHQQIDSRHVIKKIDYAHPVFGPSSLETQSHLSQAQGQRRTWFCGAWTGYGFHEDGLKSGMAVANALGCLAPWQTAGRIAA
jgi:predicted NAD/FAD-binding protein